MDHDEIFFGLIDYIAESPLTYQELAARCDVSPATLWRWYKYETTRPQLRTILKVASGLGLELVLRKQKTPLRLVK